MDYTTPSHAKRTIILTLASLLIYSLGVFFRLGFDLYHPEATHLTQTYWPLFHVLGGEENAPSHFILFPIIFLLLILIRTGIYTLLYKLFPQKEPVPLSFSVLYTSITLGSLVSFLAEFIGTLYLENRLRWGIYWRDGSPTLAPFGLLLLVSTFVFVCVTLLTYGWLTYKDETRSSTVSVYLSESFQAVILPSFFYCFIEWLVILSFLLFSLPSSLIFN